MFNVFSTKNYVYPAVCVAVIQVISYIAHFDAGAKKEALVWQLMLGSLAIYHYGVYFFANHSSIRDRSSRFVNSLIGGRHTGHRAFRLFKLLVSVGAVVFMLSSCAGVSPRKIDSVVETKYNHVNQKEIGTQKGAFVVKMADSSKGFDRASVTKAKKNSVKNLLVFNKFQHYNVCNINKEIPLNQIRKTVEEAGAKKHLNEKLNGMTLELTVNSVPHRFSQVDNGWKAAFGLVGSDNVYIKPEKANLVVAYRIMDGNYEVRKGTITVPNIDEEFEETVASSKNATERYLEQYDASIQTMGKLMMKKLMAELNGPGASPMQVVTKK